MKPPVFVATTLCLSVGVLIAFGSTQDSRLLDLPVNLEKAPKEEADDEQEEIPEVVLFYGQTVEGDSFFWCLDKSGSMNNDGKIAILKQEATRAILQLSAQAEFSVVAFSTTFHCWSNVPQVATTDNKTSAIDWIGEMEAEGWTCLEAAGLKVLEISNLSTKDRKKIIVVSDGVPECHDVDTSQSCLDSITGANTQRTPIDCFYISSDDQGIQFMRRLASRNHGSFVLVN